MKRKGPTIEAPTPDSVKAFVEGATIQKDRRLKRTKGGDVELIQQTREYELITPLFGGGTETKKADPVSIIRVPSIRGQLRFWWRAIRGGQFGGSVESMKEREDEIFGAASVGDKARPSQVHIILLDWAVNGEDRPFEVVAGKPDYRGRPRPKLQPRKGSIVPPYAAFPLQPKADEMKIGMGTNVVQVGVFFKIYIAFPRDIIKEIEAALWAWETFGGIGARTRRGFGSIKLLKVDGKNYQMPKVSEVETFIKRGLETHVRKSEFPSDVPHLSQNPKLRIIVKHKNSTEAWRYLIERLRQFRQYRKDKEGELSPFGKSQWTEPDMIRFQAGKREKPSIAKFPRAEFGLPIIFHMYHDGLEATVKGDGTNEQKYLERLSSPLILRPFECIDGAVSIALVLDTPRTPPNGLVLVMSERKHKTTAKLQSDEAIELTKRLELLNNKTDVLEAFLDTL